jgi:predicted transcriptional regulator
MPRLVPPRGNLYFKYYLGRYTVQTDESGIPDILSLTAEVVASFVGNNSLPEAELPALIHSVYAALTAIATGAVVAPEPAPKEPAVPVRKSITPDYLICLDDGRRFKSLKQHLAGLGMTPQEYRDRWKLPGEYPMVAPNYAAVRSAVAKKNNLGSMHRKAGDVVAKG